MPDTVRDSSMPNQPDENEPQKAQVPQPKIDPRDPDLMNKINQGHEVISNQDPRAPEGMYEVDANLLRPSQGVTGQQIPGEAVHIPSEGRLYAENHPARGGIIHVRGMTTKEEEILVTERLQRQGIAIDMVLSNCITTPGINTLDLLSGDRTHLLYYLRAISYGPIYKFMARMRDGYMQEVKANVAELNIKTLEHGFTEPFPVQVNGVTYELRLSRGHDEQKVVRARIANQTNNKGQATEIGGTESLINLIVSVNGDEDKKKIRQHVESMPVRAVSKLRRALVDATPGPILTKTVYHEQTGHPEEVTIQVSESFFRSDD